MARLCQRFDHDIMELITTDGQVQAACRALGFVESNGYDLLIMRAKGLPEKLFTIDAWFLTTLESAPAFF